MEATVWRFRAGWLAIAWVLGACGGGQQATGGAATPETKPAPASAGEPVRETGEGQGCPEEPRVTVLLSVTTPEGQAWMMHERQLEESDDPPDDEGTDARKLSEQEARALEVPEQGGPVWVFFEEEAPPCRMEAKAPWVVRVGDGPPASQLVYEVEGACRLSHDQGSYLALRSGEPVGACRSHGLPTVVSDEAGEGKAVPEAMQAVLPANECKGEKCFRWILRSVHLEGGTGLMEASAVWIHPPEGDDPPCAAPFDGFHEVFLQADRQAPWEPVPGLRDVRALLYDKRGLRAVVTDARGLLELWTANGQGSLEQVWRKPYTSWNEENQTPMDAIQPSCL